MTTQSEYNDALESVSLIVLGRRTALRTQHVRGDASALLKIAEELHRGDLTSLAADDPEFQLKARQVTRKLEAIESLKVLAQALKEFEWE